MALLDIDARERDATTVIALTGELDISSAAQVEQELTRAEERGPGTIVVDLSALEFMDSSGLRVVVSAHQRAQTRGTRLAVVRGPEAVHRVFRITRLDERLDIVDAADQVP